MCKQDFRSLVGYNSWQESAVAAVSDMRNAGLWFLTLTVVLRGFEAGELRLSILRTCPSTPLDVSSFGCVVGLFTTESCDTSAPLGGSEDFKLSPALVPPSVWATLNTALALSRWGFLALCGTLQSQNLNLSRQVLLYGDNDSWGASSGNGGLEILCNGPASWNALKRPKLCISEAMESMRLTLVALAGAWILFRDRASSSLQDLKRHVTLLCTRLGRVYSDTLYDQLMYIGEALQDFVGREALASLYEAQGFNALHDSSQFSGIFARLSVLWTGKMAGDWTLGGGYEVGASEGYKEVLPTSEEQFSDNSQDLLSARVLVRVLSGSMEERSREGLIYEDALVLVDEHWNISELDARSTWTLNLLSLFIDSLRPLFRYLCKISVQQASGDFNGLWKHLKASPLFIDYEKRDWVPKSLRQKLTVPSHLLRGLFQPHVDESLYEHILRGEEVALSLIRKDVVDSYDGRALRRDLPAP